jgi:hypothetical protein
MFIFHQQKLAACSFTSAGNVIHSVIPDCFFGNLIGPNSADYHHRTADRRFDFAGQIQVICLSYRFVVLLNKTEPFYLDKLLKFRKRKRRSGSN